MDIREIHKEFKDHGDPGTIKLVIKFIDSIIEKRREMNDAAEGDDIIKNQGGIIALKELKDVLILREKKEPV